MNEPMRSPADTFPEAEALTAGESLARPLPPHAPGPEQEGRKRS